MEAYLNNREEIEWLNTWFSCANQKIDRFLLIGDSVTRQLRSKFEKFFLGKIAVDLFAASYAIDDLLFWRNLNNFFDSGYQYKMILINYCFHHGVAIRCHAVREDAELFKENYKKLLALCKTLSDNVIIMTGNAYIIDDNADLASQNAESEVLARNAIVKEVARDCGCPIFDFCDLMRTEGKIYQYVDFVHFEDKAYYFTAYKILSEFQIINACEYQTIRKKLSGLLEIYGERKVAIYGTGVLGNYLYFILKYYFPEIEIVFWVVTNKDKDEDVIYNIPVYKISEVDERCCLLLLAASERSRQEMKCFAEKAGFCRIVDANIE